jgi:hypothetical protein
LDVFGGGCTEGEDGGDEVGLLVAVSAANRDKIENNKLTMRIVHLRP